MSAKPSSDPFDIPAHLVPPAVVYQWCAKRQLGKLDPTYTTMVDAGWRAVPFQRHADYFPESYCDPFAGISYGGQVLMERPKVIADVSRETELDRACVNAKQGRVVAVDLALRVRLGFSELSAAKEMRLSGSQYASRKVQMLADGTDDNAFVRGANGALYFDTWTHPRVPRHAALRWLFNLISVEKAYERD